MIFYPVDSRILPKYLDIDVMMKIFVFVLVCFFPPAHSSAEGAWTHIQEVEGHPVGIVRSVALGPDGSVWFGGDNGLFRYNEEKCEVIRSTKYLSSIAIDKFGAVWIIEWGKLLKFSNERWITFSTEGWQPGELAIAQDGTLWITSTGKGIYHFDGNAFTLFSKEDGLANNNVTYIKGMPNGDVWCRYGSPEWCEGPIMCAFGGTTRFNGKKFETFDIDDGLILNAVTSIAGNRKGDIYISYEVTGGISLYNGMTWKTITSLFGGYIAVGPDDVLWSVDIYGPYLRSYTEGIWKIHEGMPKVLSIGSIVVDINNKVWLGGQNGIISYTPNITSIVHFNSNERKIDFIGNYPNPFNQNTKIMFKIPKDGNVKFKIYSLSGQEIRTIFQGIMKGGVHSITWNGKNENGILVASGLYLSCLSMNDQAAIHRILFIK